MKTKSFSKIVLLSAFFLFDTNLFGQTTKIDWFTFDLTGGTRSSAGYFLQREAVQYHPYGTAQSTNYRLTSGYLNLAIYILEIQTGSISGKVTKSDRTTGISQAVVEAIQSGVVKSSATTSGDGTYQLINLSTGTYDVRATASGYIPQAKSGQIVNTGQITTVDFALLPIGAEIYLFETKWGSQGSGDGKFNLTMGVVVDTSGNVCVSDYNNHRIQKFSSSGVFLAKWGTSGSGDGQLNAPEGIAVDTSGNVYVSNAGNNRIEKFSSNGAFLSKFGIGQLAGPYGVAVDTSGNVYVGDEFHHQVKKFGPDGTLVASWGSQGSGDGQFDHPRGVAVDAAGNVYVADGGNNRIQKFDSNGTFLTKWGSSGTGDGDLNGPSGLAVDSSGNLYVADTINHRIQKFTSDGTFIAKWGSYGSGNGQFDWPRSVALDSSGNVYVTDSNNHRVQKFKGYPAGWISGKVTVSGSTTPISGAKVEVIVPSSQLTVSSTTTDTSGNYSITIATGTYDVRASSSGYQTQTKTGYTVTAGTTTIVNFVLDVEKVGIITTVAGTGTGGYSGDGGQATSAQLYRPRAIVLDDSGNFYIADRYNHRIRKVSTSGIITTVAGTGSAGYSGDNGQATSAQLYYPSGVTLDSSGNLYIADGDNHRIRKVSTSGIITTVAGTGSAGYSGDNGQATSAQLYHPDDVVLDSSGNLYIADYNNNCIRKVSTFGIITTVAGTGIAGYSGDNGQATSAQLYHPTGVALDSLGNTYIADSDNHRIRKVSTSGIITTVAGTGSAGYSGDNGQATSAQINCPHVVSKDSSGNLYITDTGNNYIRKVSTSGIITTVAGTGSAGYSGDNGQATSAQLYYPTDVVLDSLGNLYIADYSNHRIRKVTFAPVITGTISGKVTKADGVTGIGGAKVEVISPQSIVVSSTTTSSDGTYQLVNLSTGTYGVRFSKPYYATKTVSNVNIGAGTTILNVSLEESYGYISGKVTQPGGVTGISGAKIEVVSPQSIVVSSATTNSSGNYFLYVPTGTYDLAFSASNYSSLLVSNVRVYSSSTTMVNVSLSSFFGTVYGVVKDSATGSPVGGAKVEVLKAGEIASLTLTMTDSGGSYSINYTSGTYEIKASKKGYLSERKISLNIFVDSQTQVNFSLLPFPQPQINSPSHPSENTWYSNANPTFNWNVLTGAVSYFYLLDKTSDTPVSSLNAAVIVSTYVSFTNINEGIWYFHLTGVDSEGGLSIQKDYTVRIDTTPPSALTLNSPTHPDSENAYLSKVIKILITPPSDTSGIVGYYYVFDTSSGTIPTTGSSYLTAVAFSTTTVEDGTYYLHLIAKDNASNLSLTPTKIKIKIKTKVSPSEDNAFFLADGTKVEIPSGTLENENKIEVTTPTVVELVTQGKVRADITDEKIKGSGIIREIVLATPVGLNKEITIEIPYTASEIAGLTVSNLRIAQWRGGPLTGLWEIITSTAYPAQKKVVGSAKATGIFRIVKYAAIEEAIADLVNYPNPFFAKKQKTKIRYHLKESSEVEIRIYDLLGGLVWEKKIPAGGRPGGIAGPNEIEWDGKNAKEEYVAMGGYICLVKAGNKTLKRKIGVK